MKYENGSSYILLSVGLLDSFLSDTFGMFFLLLFNVHGVLVFTWRILFIWSVNWFD